MHLRKGGEKQKCIATVNFLSTNFVDSIQLSPNWLIDSLNYTYADTRNRVMANITAKAHAK